MIKEFKYKDKAEWLQLRKNYIGGSDASAVIGLNPWRSAYTLWAEKTGKIPEFEGNTATTVGSYLEELIAKLWEEETGKKCRRQNRMFVNDLYPWACADIDRQVVGENAGLEIKNTTSVPVMRQLRNSDEFPEIYYTQCVHYLAVKGWDRIYLAVLVNCRELKVYCLERDEAEIDALMRAERDFWAHVENDMAPSPDGADNTTETIDAIYTADTVRDEPERVDLIGYNDDLDNYMSLQAQIKDLTRLKDEIANRIKDELGDNVGGETGLFTVSWAPTTRTTFDAKRFAEDHAGVDLTPYYKTSASRIFRVTAKPQNQ